MAEKPASEKTEQPTQRRLDRAIEKGQVAQSQELPAAISILVLAIFFALMASSMLRWCINKTEQGLTCQRDIFSNVDSFISFFSAQIMDVIIFLCPILAFLTIGSILSCMATSGLNFSSKALKIKWDAVNPIKGFGNLFNMKTIVKLGLSIAKLAFVSAIVYFYIKDKSQELTALRWAWSSTMLSYIGIFCLDLMFRISIGLLAIALTDVIYQKWQHNQQLKMTKQEVKEDRKDTDGSPEVKSRIRQIQLSMAQKRLMQDVPLADLILVNPTHYAVALKYDSGQMAAPVMLAKGADTLAEKIREIARANGIPIIRRPQLTRAIYSSVEPGNSIPSHLYAAVAEVMAMLYRLKHNR